MSPYFTFLLSRLLSLKKVSGVNINIIINIIITITTITIAIIGVNLSILKCKFLKCFRMYFQEDRYEFANP